MQPQNFKNHSRMVPLFHFGAFSLVLIAIGCSIKVIVSNECDGIFMGLIVLVLSIVVLLALWYLRVFALKAQDRAIKSEEALRYFIATGKSLPKELQMSQIIALRFASDEEWQSLMQQAIEKNWSSKEIKMQIKNWRGDYYRV